MKATIATVAVFLLICCVTCTSHTHLDSKLLEKASNGDRHAQTQVGFAYLVGDGIQKDYAGALEWFTKAAEQNEAGGPGNVNVTANVGCPGFALPLG